MTSSKALSIVAPIRIFAVPMMEKTKICKLFLSEFYCSNITAFEQSEYFAGKWNMKSNFVLGQKSIKRVQTDWVSGDAFVY